MSDQERISPYNINTIPSSQVMRTFKTYIMRIVWQTVIRKKGSILSIVAIPQSSVAFNIDLFSNFK